MSIPQISGSVPFLDTSQMREVDRAMIEDYHIDLIQMMENAGRSLAHLARERFLDGDAHGRSVTLLAGTGGNGGGALVCARRLHNYGAAVTIYISKPDAAFSPVAAHQLDILRRIGATIHPAEEIESADRPQLIIDGLIGYSLRGRPRGPAAQLIAWANQSLAPVLALDAPSGLDTTRGPVHQGTIRAAATMTLALPKAGLLAPGAGEFVGELYLADISVPPALYANETLRLTVGHIFSTSDIVRIR